MYRVTVELRSDGYKTRAAALSYAEGEVEKVFPGSEVANVVTYEFSKQYHCSLKRQSDVETYQEVQEVIKRCPRTEEWYTSAELLSEPEEEEDADSS